MKKAFLFLLALFGMPLVWALGLSFLEGIALGISRDDWLTPGCVGFFAGVLILIAFYAWKRNALDALYVFAHEVTHALVGLLCLAKVHRIHIAQKSGYTQLSKENILITLSPYCVPFYLLLAVGLYGLLRLIVDEPLPFYLWAGLFGALTAFHVLKTVDTLLGVSQPDTHVYGRLFSYWFILCMNLFFALLALCLTHLVGWKEQATTVQAHVVEAYTSSVQFLLALIP